TQGRAGRPPLRGPSSPRGHRDVVPPCAPHDQAAVSPCPGVLVRRAEGPYGGHVRRRTVVAGGWQMNARRRLLGALRWLALAPALLALARVAAQAADLRQGPEVTIAAGTTVADDLYAGAGAVRVDGTIAGSLIAAGGTVDVTGKVERDVLVTGGTVTLS